MPPKAEPTPERGTILIAGRDVPYAVTRSRQRRRTVALGLEGEALRILAPMRTSTAFLRHFMESRAAWIAQRLAEQAQRTSLFGLQDGGTVPYLGHACRLHIVQGTKSGCRLYSRRWQIELPLHATDPAHDAEVKLELRLWLKKRARIVMRRRLDLWAAHMGVSYTGFALSGAERRWGSCSADDHVRLNWRLMLAPLPLLDYVVAHELAHVAHKDHSDRFWAFLAQAMPDYKSRRRQLRALERTLLFV